MRISGGLARGIPLQVPRGDITRPATDGLRQAVFSSLASWLPGARFADLFAGSGGYGLEAFSRGASGGVFVENHNRALTCLRANIEAVTKSVGGSRAALSIAATDALTWTPAPAAKALPELIFIDPPYALIPQIGPELLKRLTTLLVPQPDPLIIFELPGELDLPAPDGWQAVKRLGKGTRQPTVQIYRKRDAENQPDDEAMTAAHAT